MPWVRAISIGLRDWFLWALVSLFIWKLADRYPLERKSFGKHFGIHVASCAIVVFIFESVGFLFSEWFPRIFGIIPFFKGHEPHPEFGDGSFGSLFFSVASFKLSSDAVIFWMLVFAWYALNYSQRLQERFRIEAELKSSLTEARLRALKMQLQPHFLFNTLNAIAALVRQSPKTAELMIGSLSELLRSSLDLADRQEIPLREELEIMNCYLAIEELRFGDRLTVRKEIDPSVLDALVPTMVLQPIVENAMRHGVEPNLADSLLAIIACREEEALIIVVQDNGPGFGQSIPDGIGLQNTRARLQQLYAGPERLRCDAAPGGGARVTLRLPFRQTPLAAILTATQATGKMNSEVHANETANSDC